MKHYFFALDDQQHGPFTLEELKDKNLKPETLVWYEGLEKWVRADELGELKEVLSISPPPLPSTPPPSSSAAVPQAEVKKSSGKGKVIAIIFGSVALIVLVVALKSGNTSKSMEDQNRMDQELDRIPTEQRQEEAQDDYEEVSKPPTEAELREELFQKEISRPGAYLTSEYTYRYRWLAEKFELKGHFSNSATIATFKDIQFTLIFYSRTDTELSRSNHVLYKYVAPGSSTDFFFDVEAPDAAKKVKMIINNAKGQQGSR